MDNSPQSAPSSWSRLSILLSLLILSSLLLDLGMRFLPVSTFAFRGWEVSRLYPVSIGPHTPNFRYFNPQAYGDLSNISNRPQYRIYRPERLTTDALGFRSVPQASTGGPVQIVLLGDSFAEGAATSDSQTLAAQLAEATGVRVYDATGFLNWDTLTELLTRLKVRGATVLLEFSQRSTPQLELESYPGLWPVRAMRQALPQEQYRSLRNLYRTGIGYSQYSPLRILLTRAFRTLQNDRWLPNVYAALVFPGELRNSHQMLFWEFSRSPGTATVDVEYFARVQARVRQTGNELLVVTVPEKHQVYGRLLKHPDGSSVIPVSTHSFQDLARDVEAAKIPVVDLTSVLSEQANRLFLNGQYNYHDDDTHWNPVGIRLGSEAIAAKWRSMSEARGGQR